MVRITNVMQQISGKGENGTSQLFKHFIPVSSMPEHFLQVYLFHKQSDENAHESVQKLRSVLVHSIAPVCISCTFFLLC